MRSICFIRHAKSSWSDTQVADYDRNLNKRGKRDAPFMAARLAERLSAPDLIISSPAKRAQKTATAMAREIGYNCKLISYMEEIYHGSTTDLLHLVKEIDNKNREVFLVGHNYALTDLAEYLTGEKLGNIPTCGMVLVQCDAEVWNDVSPACCSMLFFEFPKMYPKLK